MVAGRWRAPLAALLTSVIVVGALSGCSSATESAEGIVVTAPDDVTAQGVVLAAVLLSTADITAVVAEGLVTPAEVDAARAAIADGTLGEWRERAAAELREQN